MRAKRVTRTTVWGAAFAMATILAPAGAVWAGDGAFEISQACAPLGCFPGDSGGFPVTTQKNKKYVLTSDVTVPSANTSAVVLAEGTTLDLNGFSLVGPVTCPGAPDPCSETGSGVGIQLGSGSAVRNGGVRGFGSYGLSLSDAVLVEGVIVEQNGGPGMLGSSEGSIIRDCRVFRNGSDAISLAFASGSPGTVIQGNTIFENNGDGVRGDKLVILDNAIHGNTGLALRLNFVSSDSGFAQNVMNNNNGGSANPQTAGGIQIGTNVCGGNTTCP